MSAFLRLSGRTSPGRRYSPRFAPSAASVPLGTKAPIAPFSDFGGRVPCISARSREARTLAAGAPADRQAAYGSMSGPGAEARARRMAAMMSLDAGGDDSSGGTGSTVSRSSASTSGSRTGRIAKAAAQCRSTLRRGVQPRFAALLRRVMKHPCEVPATGQRCPMAPPSFQRRIAPAREAEITSSPAGCGGGEGAHQLRDVPVQTIQVVWRCIARLGAADEVRKRRGRLARCPERQWAPPRDGPRRLQRGRCLHVQVGAGARHEQPVRLCRRLMDRLLRPPPRVTGM